MVRAHVDTSSVTVAAFYEWRKTGAIQAARIMCRQVRRNFRAIPKECKAYAKEGTRMNKGANG